MAFFSHNDDSYDFNRQIAALQKEVAALSRAASRRGASAYHDASKEAAHLYGDLSTSISDAMPAIRERARTIEHSVRENPGRAVAAVGLAALVISAAVYLSSRRD